MKTIFFTFLILLGLASVALANKPEVITLRPGQQRSAGHGEITIKFVSVEEDSRCPAESACVWAGNARIKVRIGYRKGDSKMVSMNTNMGPKGDEFGGWAVNLTNLTPISRHNPKSNPHYSATFSITRMSR